MLLESDNFVQSFPFCPHIQLMISRATKFVIFGCFQSHPHSIARFKATAGSLQPFACIQTSHTVFVKEEIILSAVFPHHPLRWTSFPFCFTVTHLFSILPQQCQDLGQWCRAHKVFWRFGRQEAVEAAQECSTNVPLTQRTWEWQSAHHREAAVVHRETKFCLITALWRAVMTPEARQGSWTTRFTSHWI